MCLFNLAKFCGNWSLGRVVSIESYDVNEMFESLGLGFVDLPDGEKHSLLEIPYPSKLPETMLF